MTQIEIDIRDWQVTTHLPDGLWRAFAQGCLSAPASDVLHRHLLGCPCCQDQLSSLETSPPLRTAA